jgi:pyruvate,water dikinase
MIYSLNDKLDINEVGGKAFNLSFMLGKKINIPKGYVISSEVTSIENIDSQLNDTLPRLSSKVMVRSSAIGEDGSDHSFAGQLDSFLVENNISAVKEAIIKCWASLKNSRSTVYAQEKSVSLTKMGVIIQDLIEPDYAGVFFTHSPSDSAKMYCEYVEGHAEKLVSGEVTPASFEFSKTLPSTPFSLHALVNVSKEIFNIYGGPQDIEWAIKDNILFIVQSRPITSLKTKIQWSNTNVNENYPDQMSPFLFSIAKDSYYHYFKNLGKELGFINNTSIHLEKSLSNTVGLWGNKIYYNMTNIHHIMSFNPVQDLFKSSFDEFVGYQKRNELKEKTGKLIEVSKFVFNLIKEYRKLPKRVIYIEKLVDEYAKDVKGANHLSQYQVLFHRFLDIRFNQWINPSFADFFAMISHGTLGKLCQIIEPKKYAGLQNGLLQALPNLVSNQPIFEMYDIHTLIEENPEDKKIFNNNSPEDVISHLSPKLKHRIDLYLEQWGYRCSGELTFLTKNYCEDPSSFIQVMKSYRSTKIQDPKIQFDTKAKEREDLYREAKKRIRNLNFINSLVLRLIFPIIVKATIKGIASRERVRLKQAKVYFNVKVILLKIGKVLSERKIITTPNSIFFLTYQEISAITGGHELNTPYQELINLRQKTFKDNADNNNIYPANFYTYLEDENQKPHVPYSSSSNDGLLRGLAACSGTITAKVRVLETIHEISKLSYGEILVTKQTDPGWICAFPIIGGLIVENGGVLSHGAIVAREFGIPAIVGVENITALLKDGDEVLLDGDLGIITKI